MAQLEADLQGEDMQSDDIDTGKDRVTHPNKKGRSFAIKQGWRRRHPTRVLNQFAGATNTTSNASSRWEEALVYGTKRVDLPDEFRPNDDMEGMSNQIGLVSASLDNYKASKNKLGRLHLVGV